MRVSWLFSAYQRLSVRTGGSKERSIKQGAVHPLPSTSSPSPPRSLKAQAHYYCHVGPAETWHSLVHLIELDIPACLGIVRWHENAAAFFHDKNERPRQHLSGDLRAMLPRGTRSLSGGDGIEGAKAKEHLLITGLECCPEDNTTSNSVVSRDFALWSHMDQHYGKIWPLD